MRLLHVVPTLNEEEGGPPSVARQFSQAQVRAGHQVGLATLDCSFDAGLILPGVEVVALGPAYGNYRYAPNYRRWLKDFAQGYDAVIVHGVFQDNLVGAWQTLPRIKIPYFVYAHGALDPWFRRYYPGKEFKKSIYKNFILRPALQKAAALIFTSSDEHRLAGERLSLDGIRALTLPLGIENPPPIAEADRVAFFRKYPQLQTGAVWLFLGRLHPKKGVDVLLASFRRIAETFPDIQLLIVGPEVDRLYSEALRSQVAQMPLKIRQRITWAGMLTGSEKWVAYRSADVFVLPSHSENFCLALVEALSCGVPVISTRRVNIWKEVEADGGGWFGEDSVEDVARLMNRWGASGDSIKNGMRSAARQSYASRFGVDQAAEQLTATIARTLT